MTDLQQRYGGPRRTTRVVALVVIVAMAASGVGFVGWTVFAQSNPAVVSQLTGWRFPDDHTALVNITVKRESQFTEAVCRLRAISEDHTVVGEISVPVTDGPEKQSLQVQIRTERPATSVESLGCTAPGQSRPR